MLADPELVRFQGTKIATMAEHVHYHLYIALQIRPI